MQAANNMQATNNWEKSRIDLSLFIKQQTQRFLRFFKHLFVNEGSDNHRRRNNLMNILGKLENKKFKLETMIKHEKSVKKLKSMKLEMRIIDYQLKKGRSILSNSVGT